MRAQGILLKQVNKPIQHRIPFPAIVKGVNKKKTTQCLLQNWYWFFCDIVQMCLLAVLAAH